MPMKRQKNLPEFAFVLNLGDGKAKSLQRSVHDSPFTWSLL
jgi:hypothetical protein